VHGARSARGYLKKPLESASRTRLLPSAESIACEVQWVSSSKRFKNGGRNLVLKEKAIRSAEIAFYFLYERPQTAVGVPSFLVKTVVTYAMTYRFVSDISRQTHDRLGQYAPSASPSLSCVRPCFDFFPQLEERSKLERHFCKSRGDT
jgi:hypothetical protein